MLLNPAQLKFPVAGKSLSTLLDESKVQAAEGESKVVYGGGMVIGSRPPRCQRRCASCGHCRAIQVPAVPQFKNGGRGTVVSSTNAIGADTSNYKPMSWKCKCGDVIYNP
ncbi:EPIDERMAL PATTERNING FACTOR-like protein 2 isoform X2 [Nymphaea colorata]|nr:EPIDERMAL PATTERNING FACTOR-like protein 2 isoform X2 [Nymphaea colorata]XP_049935668.1 EPIDERMAL PATTERNING FACTOR-like protein 2 isoform X2 [Nymphaea colorata]